MANREEASECLVIGREHHTQGCKGTEQSLRSIILKPNAINP